MLGVNVSVGVWVTVGVLVSVAVAVCVGVLLAVSVGVAVGSGAAQELSRIALMSNAKRILMSAIIFAGDVYCMPAKPGMQCLTIYSSRASSRCYFLRCL